MAVQLLPGAGTQEIIDLSSLVSLKEAGFQEWCYCYRGIDGETVEHLINSEIQEWNAIEVVNCLVGGEQRKAVIDGNHRWQAAHEKKVTTILARAKTYAGEEEIIEAAFRANMRNGRGMSTDERTEYALWLYWKDPAAKPNVSAIARRVGLNQSTVSRAVNKEIKRIEAEEEAEKRGTSTLEIAETERLLRAIRRYMEREVAFLGNQHGERSVEKRATALVRHIGSIKDKGQAKRAAMDIQSLGTTLAKIDFTAAGLKRKV